MSKARRRRFGGKQSAERADSDAILPPTRDERLLPFYKKDSDARFEDLRRDRQKKDSIETADKKMPFQRSTGDVEAFDWQRSDPSFLARTIKGQSGMKDDFRTGARTWAGREALRLAVTIELNADSLREAIREAFRSDRIVGECWGRGAHLKVTAISSAGVALFNAGWAGGLRNVCEPGARRHLAHTRGGRDRARSVGLDA
jgi:hypothetical protein